MSVCPLPVCPRLSRVSLDILVFYVAVPCCSSLVSPFISPVRLSLCSSFLFLLCSDGLIVVASRVSCVVFFPNLWFSALAITFSCVSVVFFSFFQFFSVFVVSGSFRFCSRSLIA